MNNSKIEVRDRDGVIQNEQGSNLQQKSEESENLLYAKIDQISRILSVYDELKILSLISRLQRVEGFEPSQIHRFLHKAVYLNNGAAYVNEIELPRKSLLFESSDIVRLYCYLVVEVKQRLEEEVKAEVKALAEQFRQHYMGSENSLFHEQHYEAALSILKDTLDLIDRNASLKDGDYWDFYDAIQAFLFGSIHQGNEGKIWGIQNFHTVWESMCLQYLVKHLDSERLLYIDERFVSDQVLAKTQPSLKIINLKNVFQVNSSKLIPDAVIIPQELQASELSYRIRKDVKGGKVWNDYGYMTAFYLSSSSYSLSPKNWFKIAYENQSGELHTFEELEKYYQVYNGMITINSPLPKTFYSFWDTNKFSKIRFEDIKVMETFNHIFYFAFRLGVKSSESFLELLHNFQPFESGVFKLSLFRDRQSSDIAEEFDTFLQKMFNFYEVLLEELHLIDIKYSSLSYYADSVNIESIKSRSIRKQFVYEYLLERFFQKNFNKVPKIQSSFCLPAYSPSADIFTPSPTYLDGYLSLTEVDFFTMVESYLDL